MITTTITTTTITTITSNIIIVVLMTMIGKVVFHPRVALTCHLPQQPLTPETDFLLIVAIVVIIVVIIVMILVMAYHIFVIFSPRKSA